jgi:putative oxidoreductase
MQKVRTITAWVLQVGLATLFILAGLAKFTSPLWPRMFTRWGYPDGFYLIVGVVEVLGAVALLVPRLAAPSASMLLAIMLGALVTHVRYGETGRVPEVAILAVLLGCVIYLRRREVDHRLRAFAARRPEERLKVEG